MAERKTVVNIYGGPGAGKSTAALQLVAELKKRGINADYVSEYAKELVYTKNFSKLDGSIQNQREIFHEQKSRLDIALEGVEVAITDSPLLLNAVYLKDKSDTYTQNVIRQFHEYNNFNILIERDLSVQFEIEGRIHNLKESIEKDTEIADMLHAYQIPFQRFDRNHIDQIADEISKERNQTFSKAPISKTAPNRERIFVDMDGVLAKFNHVQSEEELYEKGYFANLEPLPTVVDGIQRYIKENPDKDIYILSAYLTESPYALQEKNEWLDRYLPEISSDHRIFCPCGKPKADYIRGGIQKTDILLDDYTKNLVQWKSQGGIGVKLLNGINGNYGTWQDYRVTAESFHKDFTELSPTSRITIRCNLSEHPGFDDDKLYTVREFDSLMKEYDKEWQQKHPVGRCAKVRFTVNLPNATTITERQDIGDGCGGVVDFLKNSPHKHAAKLMEQEINKNDKESKVVITKENTNSAEKIFKTYQKIWHEGNTENISNEQKERPKKQNGENLMESIKIDATDFPDENFRNVVMQYDTNGDGSLSDAEIAAATSIDCRFKLIASLKGIEFFTALTSLYCGGNPLATLDVSENTELVRLECYHNDLTSLDVSQNTALTELDCDENQLTSLDVSKNPALETLHCQRNQLTTLDVSNPALQNLYCRYNQLTELNVSKNQGLRNLGCDNNQLTSLDVSHNPELVWIYCYSNQLTELDVSQNPALGLLSCKNNQLTSLNLRNNTALVCLNCFKNQLTELDVSQNPRLETLHCENNQLTFLDVSHNPELKYFGYDNKVLIKKVSHDHEEDRDISQNSKLEELKCDDEVLIKKVFHDHEEELDI